MFDGKQVKLNRKKKVTMTGHMPIKTLNKRTALSAQKSKTMPQYFKNDTGTVPQLNVHKRIIECVYIIKKSDRGVSRHHMNTWHIPR